MALPLWQTLCSSDSAIEFVLHSFPPEGASPLGRLRFVPSLRPEERKDDATLVQWLKDVGAPFLTKPLSFGRDTAPRFLAHFLNSYDSQAQEGED